MAGLAIERQDIGQGIPHKTIDATQAGNGRPDGERSMDITRSSEFQSALRSNLDLLALGMLEKGALSREKQSFNLPVSIHSGMDGSFQSSSAIISIDGQDENVREAYSTRQDAYKAAQNTYVNALQEIQQLESDLFFGPEASAFSILTNDTTKKNDRTKQDRLRVLYEDIGLSLNTQRSVVEGMAEDLFSGDVVVLTQRLTPFDLGVAVNYGHMFDSYVGPMNTISGHLSRHQNEPRKGNVDVGDGSEPPSWGPSTHLVQYAAAGSGVLLSVGGIAIECQRINSTPVRPAEQPDSDRNQPIPTPTETLYPTRVPVFQDIEVSNTRIHWEQRPDLDVYSFEPFQIMDEAVNNTDEIVLPNGSQLSRTANYFEIEQTSQVKPGEVVRLEMYTRKIEGLRDSDAKQLDNIFMIYTPQGDGKWERQLAAWVPTGDNQGADGYEEYHLTQVNAGLQPVGDRFFVVSRRNGEGDFTLSFNGHSEGNLGPIVWRAGEDVDISGFFNHLIGQDRLLSPQIVEQPTSTPNFTSTNTRFPETATPSATLTPTETLIVTIQAVNTARATDTATSTRTNTPTNTPRPPTPRPSATESEIPVIILEDSEKETATPRHVLNSAEISNLIKNTKGSLPNHSETFQFDDFIEAGDGQLMIARNGLEGFDPQEAQDIADWINWFYNSSPVFREQLKLSRMRFIVDISDFLQSRGQTSSYQLVKGVPGITFNDAIYHHPEQYGVSNGQQRAKVLMQVIHEISRGVAFSTGEGFTDKPLWVEAQTTMKNGLLALDESSDPNSEWKQDIESFHSNDVQFQP